MKTITGTCNRDHVTHTMALVDRRRQLWECQHCGANLTTEQIREEDRRMGNESDPKLA